MSHSEIAIPSQMNITFVHYTCHPIFLQLSKCVTPYIIFADVSPTSQLGTSLSLSQTLYSALIAMHHDCNLTDLHWFRSNREHKNLSLHIWDSLRIVWGQGKIHGKPHIVLSKFTIVSKL